jgi:hypothetical protein
VLADPDPTFQFDADPDPNFHLDADADTAFHFLMRIRIQLPKMVRIRIRNSAYRPRLHKGPVHVKRIVMYRRPTLYPLEIAVDFLKSP